VRGELEKGLPELDVAAHVAALAFVREQARSGDLAIHDISDGGLACAIAEMAIAGSIGARCDLDALIRTRDSEPEEALFGEGPGGYLVAGVEERVRELQAAAKEAGIDAWGIGSAGGDRLEISSEWMEPSVSVAEATAAWCSLGERFGPAAVA
jgi:phosphoribosylformylglycinamidine synthase